MKTSVLQGCLIEKLQPLLPIIGLWLLPTEPRGCGSYIMETLVPPDIRPHVRKVECC